MSHHCRCRQCGARRAIRQPLTWYIRPPKCRVCQGELRSDKWMNERNVRAMTCRCDGHLYPHRQGSPGCYYQTDGQWKTLEQFEREAGLNQEDIHAST